MDPEKIEKEIKELKKLISVNISVGQVKMRQFKLLEKELQEDALLVIKWNNQIEALQKVLD